MIKTLIRGNKGVNGAPVSTAGSSKRSCKCSACTLVLRFNGAIVPRCKYDLITAVHDHGHGATVVTCELPADRTQISDRHYDENQSMHVIKWA